jgi:hypothetical protein
VTASRWRAEAEHAQHQVAEAVELAEAFAAHSDHVAELFASALAILNRVNGLLEQARKVSPSERAVIYAADLQAALDGTGPTSIRKTGSNDAQEGQPRP